jgi:hypothetical protein
MGIVIDCPEKSATRQQMLIVNDLTGNIFSYTLATRRQPLAGFPRRWLFLTKIRRAATAREKDI